MDSINDKIKDLYSLPITEQFIVIKEVASEMLEIISERRSGEIIALAKKVMESIQGVRHMMSAHQASNGQIDGELKKTWESLKELVS